MKIRKAVRFQFCKPCGSQDGVRKISHGLRNFRIPHAKSTGSTSDNINFLVRTSIHEFLDSMESSLSLESNHILINSIWFSQIWVFYALFNELC